MQSVRSQYTIEVEESLTIFSEKIDKEKAEKLKKYIGTNLNVLGLTSKDQVETFKRGFDFLTDSKLKSFQQFHTLYMESTSFEAKNLSFIFLDKNHHHIPVKNQFKVLPKWIKKVDNWAHSDNLSKYLTRLLENDETKKDMHTLISKWNLSNSLWERRQSLICLFYYARTKKKQVEFDFAQRLILNLIHDTEYYVQKAVGWALRECYNVYPNKTYHLVKNNIKHIKPVAFTTCIEKMSAIEKSNLKSLRKK
jgi:3-methyladenine DNA glycosylase AlkD